MSVTRVVGRINGSDEIIFGKSADDGSWVASAAPNLKTGRYVVEVVAYDEAGNESYGTSFLVMFDSSDMSFKIISSNYTADTFEKIKEESIDLEYFFHENEENYSYKILPSNFSERVKIK